MELHFSCLIRKAVRFGSDAEGDPPLEDFSIVRPEALVPKRLTIDYENGRWMCNFFLQNNPPT